MKPSDGTQEGKCDDRTPTESGSSGSQGRPPDLVIACHTMTMEAFAPLIHDYAGGYLDKPVVDHTGLKEAWDFDLRWTARDALNKAGSDGISIFDAVEKQLGLKLTLETAPRPVMIVDSVNKVPTPNVAGIEKELPPLPPPQFEVATVKPAKPGTGIDGRVEAGRIDLRGATLKWLIDYAFNLNVRDKEIVANAPPWLEADHFDILAKVMTDGGAHPASSLDDEELRYLMRELLAERFQMKSHFEERPISAYVLTAVKPKMAKADPMGRTHCLQGPGPDGKDPRMANPILNKLFFCQNMNMTEFGEEMQSFVPGYISGPVRNATGLDGSFDFTLSYSSSANVRRSQVASSGTGSEPSDPTGAISFFDAVNKQLGLKLEQEKRPAQVLVIDHLEQTPTEN